MTTEKLDRAARKLKEMLMVLNRLGETAVEISVKFSDGTCIKAVKERRENGKEDTRIHRRN